MKKVSLMFLSALLVLSVVSCSSGSSGDESADGQVQTEAAELPQPEVAAETPAEPDVEEEAPPQEEAPSEPPGNVEITAITNLELSRPAEIIDGTLVMYFTDEELWYEPDAECSIGLISSEAADSIKGKLDMSSYPDMFVGDDYRGAAIIPDFPIPAGSYTFSVAFGKYLVTFDMTVN